MRDEIRRLALFTTGVAELTRYRAEQVVRDLVKTGDVRREQASGLVRDLLERNRQNRKELLDFLGAEMQHQVESLGLATRRDLARLERRVARLEAERKKTPGPKTTVPKTSQPRTTQPKTTRKKTTAKPADDSAAT